MFGFDEDFADDHCRHCGKGYWFDVGLNPTICENCGKKLYEPDLTPPPIPDDDVHLDPDYILFDEQKAFRLLKSMGLLSQCLRN